MSSSEESLDSGAPGGMKSSKAANPALWGLAGVLAGSLVSGAFSVVTAQIAFQASENSAARAQQSSERSMQEENKRARDQFLRDQRISAYKQFLTDSRLLVDAQLDYYNVLSQPRLYTPDQTRAYLSDMRMKWRQFVSSAWGLEFFSPEKVRESATNLSEELLARHDMLENYDYSNAAFERLAARVNETATKISDLRQKFADAASEVLSS